MSNVVPDSLNSFRQKQTSQRSTSSTANELQRSRGRGGGGVEESLRILRRSQGQTVRDAAKEQEDLAKQQAAQDRSDLERQMTRWWKEGDVYAPHDLSGAEMSKWKLPKARGKQSRDVCDILQLNPLDHYKNFSLMSEYITEMGRIKGRGETGLRPINQRRMAKAIRRAVGCGLLPSVHRHPEILRIEMDRDAVQRSRNLR
ncbi:ribosomal protein S18 [Elsinoe australis]|uniref:Small ribosomal subunit protein bS18m n=1 Tax=Elsinoe australis TaxID=40998 RepID=A0A2P7ZDN1_9PEZI|nr:ribosomal protein S18 [Elsinoe australis]